MLWAPFPGLPLNLSFFPFSYRLAPGLLLQGFPWVSPSFLFRLSLQSNSRERLASSGLLWLALALSFLSFTSLTRNKVEIKKDNAISELARARQKFPL